MKRRRKAGSVGRQLLPCGSCSYFYLLPATRCGTEHIKSLLASFAGKLEKLSQRLESTQVLSSIPLTIVSFISTGTSASHAFPILPAPPFFRIFQLFLLAHCYETWRLLPIETPSRCCSCLAPPLFAALFCSRCLF